MTIVKYSDDMLIAKMYAGSIAYGTNLPTSDVDFRGIFVAPAICVRTPFFPIGQKTDEREEDTTYFELSKFMQLAIDCNPNVIELLWTQDSDIVFRTPGYDLLREHAPKLMSSKIAFTTSGYALSQLKRIKGHNKWINQGDKGIAKLKQLYNDKNVTLEWLESNFPEVIVRQVTT